MRFGGHRRIQNREFAAAEDGEDGREGFANWEACAAVQGCRQNGRDEGSGSWAEPGLFGLLLGLGLSRTERFNVNPLNITQQIAYISFHSSI